MFIMKVQPIILANYKVAFKSAISGSSDMEGIAFQECKPFSTSLKILSDTKKILLNHAKKVKLKDSRGREVTALLVKPHKDNWHIECNGKYAGYIRVSESKAPIKGDNLPDYYKGKPYLFINSLASSKEFSKVGSELVKEAIKESKKRGFEGRVCLNTTTTKPECGSPVPFYYKLGFQASIKEKQQLIKNAILQKKSIPSNCESVTMFLP